MDVKGQQPTYQPYTVAMVIAVQWMLNKQLLQSGNYLFNTYLRATTQKYYMYSQNKQPAQCD